MVVADINVDNAKETVGLIEGSGGTAVAVGTDVADEQQVQAMIAAAVDKFGRLDILFNNVGIPTPRLGMTFEDHTLEDFNRLVAVNLGGVFLGCKYAVLRFKEQGGGGVILNTGSVAGLVGWGGTVYGATKGGVLQLTRAVAVEAAPFGIRVNAICPAAMPLTGFMAAGGLQVDAETAGRDRQKGRRATPTRQRDHRRGLCGGRAVSGVGRGAQRHRGGATHRRRIRRENGGQSDPDARPRPVAGAVRSPKLLQRVHGWQLSRRSVSELAPASRTRPRAPRASSTN